MATFYKVLSAGRKACHGGSYTYPAGRWTRRIERVQECLTGYHVCTLDQLSRWLYAHDASGLPLELWECEVDGAVLSSDEAKYVCQRVKLTRKIDTLDGYDLRWIATLFAEAVLHNTDDLRVGECINAVRAYSLGFLDANGLSAARNAAESAARSAAWNAARNAAESAAWSAAESTAWIAAWSAARNAAWNAAWSAARSAARNAAWNAAWSTAESTAWSAAESTAWSAQGQVILDYLDN